MSELETRVYFEAHGKHYSLAEARDSPEVWQAFLHRLGVHSDVHTDMWQTLSLLLLRGLRVQRLRNLPGQDHFLLLPFFASKPLFCSDLAREGLWNTENCCPDCHCGQRLIEHFLPDGRVAYLCCHTSFYIDSTGIQKGTDIHETTR